MTDVSMKKEPRALKRLGLTLALAFLLIFMAGCDHRDQARQADEPVAQVIEFPVTSPSSRPEVLSIDSLDDTSADAATSRPRPSRLIRRTRATSRPARPGSTAPQSSVSSKPTQPLNPQDPGALPGEGPGAEAQPTSALESWRVEALDGISNTLYSKLNTARMSASLEPLRRDVNLEAQAMSSLEAYFCTIPSDQLPEIRADNGYFFYHSSGVQLGESEIMDRFSLFLNNDSNLRAQLLDSRFTRVGISTRLSYRANEADPYVYLCLILPSDDDFSVLPTEPTTPSAPEPEPEPSESEEPSTKPGESTKPSEELPGEDETKPTKPQTTKPTEPTASPETPPVEEPEAARGEATPKVGS